MIKEGVYYCDFCYSPQPIWIARFREPTNILGWNIEICDSCRLLLRNVIGPALHRLSHNDIVGAIVKLMAERGLDYSDLMETMVEIKGREQKAIEQ